MYYQSCTPQCSSNKPANDEYEVEMLELEISEEEETGTVTSIITDLKEEIEKLNQMLKIKDQQIRNLEETNLKLKIKPAGKFLSNGNDANNAFPALSPAQQRNYANVVTNGPQVKKTTRATIRVPPGEQIETMNTSTKED